MKLHSLSFSFVLLSSLFFALPTFGSDDTESSHYADFKGTWEGTCISEENPEPMAIKYTIRQFGDREIEVHTGNQTKHVVIGGTKKVIQSYPNGDNFTQKRKAYWNSNKQELIITEEETRSLNRAKDVGKRLTASLLSTFKKDDNGKLLVSSISYVNGNKQVIACTFENLEIKDPKSSEL